MLLLRIVSFTSFSTYPISSVLVQNGGGGITLQPILSAESTYSTEDNLSRVNLSNLGILAPIQIANSGIGYVENDIIKFSQFCFKKFPKSKLSQFLREHVVSDTYDE